MSYDFKVLKLLIMSEKQIKILSIVLFGESSSTRIINMSLDIEFSVFDCACFVVGGWSFLSYYFFSVSLLFFFNGTPGKQHLLVN